MTLPSVSISKNTFTTSQAPASSVGILAVCAASSTGTALSPGGFARTDLAVAAYGIGPLTDFGAYDIAVANKPALLVKGVATYAGSYGTLNKTVAGSSVVTVGSAEPYDRYS